MRRYSFQILLLSLIFIACNKEKLDDSMTDNKTLQELILGDDKEDSKDEKDKSKKESCFELIYPLSVTMPDGTIISGDKEAIWDEIKAWYEINPESKDKPSLQYPVEIIWVKDGIIKSIEDKEELIFAKKYCDIDKKDCFKILYPITWNMPDGSAIDMSDPKDWDELKTWYETNPDSDEKPTLNYPVDVEYEDGKIVTADDEEEMIILKKKCD